MTNANKPLFYPENIPEELKKLKQWVLYRLEHVPTRTKLTKIPCQVDGIPASITNPKTWCSFEEASKTLQSGIGDGIGLVLTDNDPYCGIDLDSACYDPDLPFPEEWAEEIVKRFSSYTERSPSRTGLHIIIRGKKSITNSRKDKIEIYDNKRFLTFTGDIYNKSSKINERQAVLDAFCREIFPTPETNLSYASLPQGTELSESEINSLIVQMRSAQNGQKFAMLFDGKWKGNYPSQSEADQALCNILAFWTNNNPIAIDQIFRKSPLYREKWERDDYRNKTISNSLSYGLKQAQQAFSKIENQSPSQNKIPLIHISDIVYIPIEFQVEKIWPLNSVGFISGQPGSYKTWVVWDLATSIASGTNFMGEYKCKKGKVIAFNAEDSPSNTQLRVAAFAKQKEVSLKDLDFYLFNIHSLSLNDKDTQEEIKNTIRDERPDFIIFDPLRNVHILDEDKATEMTPLLNFLRSVNREFGCSILLVCHDKKNGQKNNGDRASQVRGTSALVGWRDNALFVDKKADYRIEIQIYNRAHKSISPFCADLIIENKAEKEEPITAVFKPLSLEQIKTEKEFKDKIQLEIELKRIIKKNGPIGRDDLRNIVCKNRQLVLNVVKDLITTNEVKEVDNKLIINDALVNSPQNSLELHRTSTDSTVPGSHPL